MAHIKKRTNVALVSNGLTNLHQLGGAIGDVLQEQSKRSRTHGPEHGDGALLLNDATHEMSSNASSMVGAGSSFGVFHTARGVDPSSHSGMERVLATLGGRANQGDEVTVLTRHLGKMRPGDSVTASVWVDTAAYGEVVRKNITLLKHLFPLGVPLWSSVLYGNADGVSEVRAVNELNRVTLEKIRDARTDQDVRLFSFQEYCRVWAPLGTCRYVATVLDTSQMHGKADALLSVTMDGVESIPNWWCDWPVPIKICDDLHFVYVARTYGLEEEERLMTLEGRHDEWRSYYKSKKKELKEAGVLRSAAAQRIQEDEAHRLLHTNGHHDLLSASTAAAATGSSLGRKQTTGLYTNLTRYARWEPYVTTDGLPPPADFLNTVSPDGVRHKGGYRTVMRVTAHSDTYLEHKSWRALVRQLLYDPTSETYSRDAKQISGDICTIPKVMGLLHTSPWHFA